MLFQPLRLNYLAHTCFLVLLSPVLSSEVSAANYFVRAGASSSGNGTSWTNAWNGFGAISWSTVACGDTIWVAGGTYGSLSPAKKCTSSSPLSIRRARSDASVVTASPGWSTIYDSTVRQTGDISFNGDYDFIIVSGRTTAVGGAYGWHMDHSGSTGGCGVCFNASSSDSNTIEYLDMQGPGYITYSSDGRAIDCTPPSGSATGNTFSHLRIWNWESGIYAVGCSAPTIEYVDMYDIGPLNWQTFHPNGVIIWGSANGVVRWSNFHKGPSGLGVGEGVFFEQSGGSSGWQIYGNLFYDLDQSGWKAIEITSSNANTKIWNNTFVNVIGATGAYGASCGTGSEYRNNFFYSAGLGSCGTASNNITAGGIDRFVNYAGKDFHIIATTGGGYGRNAGIDLAAHFSVDMDGVTFGGDGTWDVGAYEYNTSTTIQPVSAPTSVTAIVH